MILRERARRVWLRVVKEVSKDLIRDGGRLGVVVVVVVVIV